MYTHAHTHTPRAPTLSPRACLQSLVQLCCSPAQSCGNLHGPETPKLISDFALRALGAGRPPRPAARAWTSFWTQNPKQMEKSFRFSCRLQKARGTPCQLTVTHHLRRTSTSVSAFEARSSLSLKHHQFQDFSKPRTPSLCSLRACCVTRMR